MIIKFKINVVRCTCSLIEFNVYIHVVIDVWYFDYVLHNYKLDLLWFGELVYCLCWKVNWNVAISLLCYSGSISHTCIRIHKPSCTQAVLMLLNLTAKANNCSYKVSINKANNESHNLHMTNTLNFKKTGMLTLCH